MIDMVTRWRNTYKSGILGLLGAAVTVMASGCAGGLVSSTVENRIESRLPDLIGPAKSYKVEVKGSTLRMSKGKIAEVLIHGEEVRLLPELCVDTLDIRMKDVVADPSSKVMKSVGDVTFEANVSQESLNDYLERTRTDDIRIELTDGRMVVLASPGVLGLSVRTRLTGYLEPDGSDLHYRISRLQVAGINTPGVTFRLIEDRINPVVTLVHAQFSTEIVSATIKSSGVAISGKAQLLNGRP